MAYVAHRNAGEFKAVLLAPGERLVYGAGVLIADRAVEELVGGEDDDRAGAPQWAIRHDYGHGRHKGFWHYRAGDVPNSSVNQRFFPYPLQGFYRRLYLRWRQLFGQQRCISNGHPAGTGGLTGSSEALAYITLQNIGAAVLNGTFSDASLPAGSTLTATWTKVSGPGPVTFSTTTISVPNPGSQQQSADTTVSFILPGTYTLRLTATAALLSSSTDVTVIVNPLQQTPALASVNPNNGVQGQQNLSVTITGQNTHFVQGATTASFGAGITVVSLTVNSPTSATAAINIDPTATIGPRTVTLTTASEITTLNSAFTVTAATTGAPTMASVNPNTGRQGQQNLTVALIGQSTHWAQGTTTASFGAGITVASLAVNSATTATAVLNIDSAATTGPRTITMTTGTEVDTLANGFEVTPGNTSVEADSFIFSVLNTSSPTGTGPSANEVDSLLFSVLNTASPTGSGTTQTEADTLLFSVLNTASPSGSSSSAMEADSLLFSILNTSSPGGTGAIANEVDSLIFSVENTNTSAAIERAPAAKVKPAGTVAPTYTYIPLTDSDGNGYPDYLKIALGADPNDPSSIPNINPPGEVESVVFSVSNGITLRPLRISENHYKRGENHEVKIVQTRKPSFFGALLHFLDGVAYRRRPATTAALR